MNDASSHAAQRARTLLELGRDGEAADLLRQILHSRPEDTEALALLAEATRRTDAQASYQAAQAALRSSPSSAWVHVVAAWSAHALDRGTEARTLVQAAIQLDPESAMVHQAAAQLLAKDPGTQASAMVSAGRAMELAPQDPVTWIAAGNASLSGGLIEDARNCYLRALHLDPNNRTARSNLAAVEEQSGSVAHAMDLLTMIIRLDPSDFEAMQRFNSVATRLLHEFVWLSLPVGFCLAAVVELITGAR